MIRFMCHDPRVWDEPNTFKPERFLGEIKEPMFDPLALIFGFGRRCACSHLSALRRNLLMQNIGSALGDSLQTTWFTHSCSHYSGRMIYSLIQTTLLVPMIASTPSLRTRRSALRVRSSVYSSQEIRVRQFMSKGSSSRLGCASHIQWSTW